MMLKILNAYTREEIYFLFECHRLQLEEQKKIQKATIGMNKRLNIDQQILKDKKTPKKLLKNVSNYFAIIDIRILSDVWYFRRSNQLTISAMKKKLTL